ncbi:MAG TPA: DUF4349 domain-containing protein [Acidimicrobiales bacterium]
MNPIDEDVLTNALHDVADSFEISRDAASRIATEAASVVTSPRLVRLPAFIHHQSRTRLFLVAAALVVVVAGISVPLLHGEVSPTHNPSFEALPPRVGEKAATTNGAAGAHLTAPSPVTGAVTTSNLSITGTGFTLAASSTPSGSLKIESTGTIALTVQGAKVSPAFSKLTSLVTSDGGFVNSTNAHVGTRGSGKFSYGTIVLQVPQHSFALLVAQVQHVGRATSVSSNSADVTSQYVDLTARITAFKASRQQYLAIMKRATTISGILAVQSQLNNLQSQIEQLQGQLNVLNNETTYATLSVTVSEAGQHSLVVHPRTGFSKAWHDSIRGFVSGFEWLVRIGGPVLFALLLLGALSFLGRFAWRANRRRRI